MLHGKKILLGITGGIAAYKCAQLVRLFIKEGAEVKVVITKNATQFITIQTLAVLSKNEVTTDFFDNNLNWNNHVHLAEWADVLIIAPLTANTLGKMANGVCDNILLATYLSARAKTIVAPAMDLDMYKHPTTERNLKTLESFGNLVIPAESGELASGLTGEGRMAEPENILKFLNNYFSESLPLKDKKVMINAGPTYEAIDPVRFIGNRSSGKMGIALAESFYRAGAEVTLILGPTHLLPGTPCRLIRVESAEEMYNRCSEEFDHCDIAVCAAAVADYKPLHPAKGKIKKTQSLMSLELEKTKDILKSLGEKKKRQCLIGFALETENLEEYAKEKIKNKKLDFIVANEAGRDTGFSSDTNKVTIIDKHNKITNFELKSKAEAANDIVNFTVSYLNEKGTSHSS